MMSISKICLECIRSCRSVRGLKGIFSLRANTKPARFIALNPLNGIILLGIIIIIIEAYNCNTKNHPRSQV